MLNLSDKELDRFSKEAAQEYEPGDVLGDRSWDRLRVRLDGDIGRVRPNLLRHIRRFPFYYAPAMLVLLGVSYYLIRHTSKSGGSPPSPVVKAPATVVQNPLSSQSPENTQKSTLNSSTAAPTLPAEKAGGVPVGGSQGAASNSAEGHTADAGNAGARAGASVATARENAAGAGTRADAATTAGGSNPRDANSPMASSERSANAATGIGTNRTRRGKNARGDNDNNSLAITAPANASRATAGRQATAGTRTGAGVAANAGSSAGAGASADAGSVANIASSTNAGSGAGASGAGAIIKSGQMAQERTLGRASLQGLRPTKKAPHINDSALRAFTLKSTAPQLIRKGGAHINRSLEFGVLAAPDFASVNSLAGDRPGSTIGLTVDYKFANHWYVGSGLLLDRKIFAARAQDFHAPPDFYQDNGMRGDVDLIKGSFEMLEIPLNLRYDFSVTGSTLFFLSGGLSSYLLASENNNYYYHTITSFRDQCMPISSPDKSYLFSALNLSMGVETGLSNSLSLLIAPYMKIPVRGVGIGQVQMSTVGINFSFKFAPVISRKRY
jgi:Outer membrane protein beta-barrel domain